MNIARYWLWLLVTMFLFASSGWAERLPLQKKSVNLDFKFPDHYEKWHGPPDPRTGISREHDPQPRVIPLGKNPGRYAFEWIALDGTKKRVIYDRPDGTDAIVTARVSELQDGYRYTYQIEVLPSSPAACACEPSWFNVSRIRSRRWSKRIYLWAKCGTGSRSSERALGNVLRFSKGYLTAIPEGLLH